MRNKMNGYVCSVLTVAVATGVASLLARRIAPTNLVMIYLLGVVFVAAGCGRGPSIVASFLSVATFDFLFVPPYVSLAVDDTEYVLTLAVMLGVALLTSGLMSRVRRQAEAARVRERHTSTLYRMSREFSRALDRDEIVRIAEEEIGNVLGADVWLFLPTGDGDLAPAPGVMSRFPIAESEMQVARWVSVSGRSAGRGTGTFSDAKALYVPVTGTRDRVGVLGILEHERSSLSPREGAQLLEGAVSQLALALERDGLAMESQQVQVRFEADRLRDALLRSVSHDFRTPLATITGAASGLMDGDFDEPTRRDMLQSIWDEADRLNRFVNNLLNMTRLESGALKPRKEWHPLEEVVGSALTILKRRLGDRSVRTRAAADLPLVPMDGILIEQVLVNLVENALRHAGSESPVEIDACERTGEVEVSVADRGPGIPPGSESELFSGIGRARMSAGAGMGLGLAICRGIVEAHGGRICATNREGGGARFSFTLPLPEGGPATLDEESEEEAPAKSRRISDDETEARRRT